MKLNIYDRKEIVKTYEADTYDLMFGTLEDVANAMKLDDMKTGTTEEIMKMAVNLVTNSMDTVKDLLKDLFDGITDEEIRHTRISEIIQVFIDVVTYTIKALNKNFASKN